MSVKSEQVVFRTTVRNRDKWDDYLKSKDGEGFRNLSDLAEFAVNYIVKKKVKKPLTT